MTYQKIDMGMLSIGCPVHRMAKEAARVYLCAEQSVYDGSFDAHGQEATDFVHDIAQAYAILSSPMLESHLIEPLEEAVSFALYSFSDELLSLREEA